MYRRKNGARNHYGHPVQRFLDYILIDVVSGCWNWQGKLGKDGYGAFSATVCPYNPYGSHRFMWEIVHGTIPVNQQIRHTCDNPRCCNVDHMELGTHKQNNHDRYRRNRVPLMFTDEEVAYIRRVYQATPMRGRRKAPYANQLAKQFNTIHQNIDRVARGYYASGGYRTKTPKD